MQHPARVRLADPIVAWSLAVTVATLAFGRLQNQGHLVGGEISLAKTLWLNLTIVSFLVVPGCVWRDSRVSRRMRRIFGFIFASFVVRAAVELPVLYTTDWWRCAYGIAHDLATAAGAVFLFLGSRTARQPDDRHSGFLGLILALLVVEAAFAYTFCSVADPRSGIYFAGDEPAFRTINAATWVAVVAGYPALLVLLWRKTRTDNLAPPA